MIKIELVKFEAQDVITASGTPVAPACTHANAKPLLNDPTKAYCEECKTVIKLS